MNERFRVRRHLISCLAAGLLVPSLARAAGAEAGNGDDALARRLVEAADGIRFPRDSFQTDITVTNYSDGEARDERVFRVLSRGNENTIVMTMSPASERGQALLMRGRDLWVFMPTVSQPVRLSLSQRLTGQVANGDLARANFSGDYNPSRIGAETVDGVAAHVLDLAAVDRGVTYARVKYWVAESDSRPLLAEFYALSGRLLKTCRYEDYREMAGRTRPTRLVIEDALKKGEMSILAYDAMTLRDLPERMFTREYLRRLN